MAGTKTPPAAAGDILEEMLKNFEMELFPKLRLKLKLMVDLLNHGETQQKIKKKANDVDRYLDAILQASTVYDILRNVRLALESLTLGDDIKTFLERLLNSGLYALANDPRNNLDFLDENNDLPMSDRVDKLFRYMEGQDRRRDVRDFNKAFKEYLISWEKNNRNHLKDDVLQEMKNQMWGEHKKAKVENTSELDSLISSLSDKFGHLEVLLKNFKEQPLVELLVNLKKNLGQGLMALTLGTGKWMERWKDPDFNFQEIRAYLIEYVRGNKSDPELRKFIADEELEYDCEYTKRCLSPWIDEVREKVTGRKTYLLAKEPIMSELSRLQVFLRAVVLNKPDLLKEHQDLLTDVMKEAAKSNAGLKVSASLLPSISFGQLSLPDGTGARKVRLTFVLDQSRSQREMREQLVNLFKNLVVSSSGEVINGLNVVVLEISVDDNVASFIAGNASKLADLSVRGVLVGEFGMAGFRHAMNPAFNRIYSARGQDTAVGFKTTWFICPEDRGGEPYFCPAGWRRYSIDVGMTGDQFAKAYKDWPVAYHGTKGHLAMAILLSGLQASSTGCYMKSGEGVVYLSPSIEYCGHPRYAQVWRVGDRFVQMVLQVRVKRRLLFNKKPGTLPGAYPKQASMDPNFKDNRELEWVIKWPPGTKLTSTNGIIVYGIMLRVTDQDPGSLPQNAWWSTPERNY